jgi:hypothetical protein
VEKRSSLFREAISHNVARGNAFAYLYWADLPVLLE